MYTLKGNAGHKQNWFSLTNQIIWLHEYSDNAGDSNRDSIYEGWNFNSGNYLFTTDTK